MHHIYCVAPDQIETAKAIQDFAELSSSTKIQQIKIGVSRYSKDASMGYALRESLTFLPDIKKPGLGYTDYS